MSLSMAHDRHERIIFSVYLFPAALWYRNKIVCETAHKNIFGLNLVIGLQFLERNMAVEIF